MVKSKNDEMLMSITIMYTVKKPLKFWILARTKEVLGDLRLIFEQVDLVI